MSPTHLPSPPANPSRSGLDGLDGLKHHSLEELSDYLDAGRTPADPAIDNSPGCQLTLSAMVRLRHLSQELLASNSDMAPTLDESWVQGVLSRISTEARAGRRIPLAHPDPVADLAITEGAVLGLIRAAESEVPGLIIGRVRLLGDVTLPSEPITIVIEASVVWGGSVPQVVRNLRQAVSRRLLAHTNLAISGIDVIVHDLHEPPVPSDVESEE
ncbi:hypothetical protein [Paeniglutamicibacter cryotolerans]|uniref:Putative alkaline shock family protein YloU n=1 Tax=Paeniglutamicibacter cryotolerans TaxID=670079 RepID=A0A839QTN3_9MICC|nr:hypothetical protein [Paeniglutamicibacter cryotolerans]MBB2995391.1 putative alkaline shock family protein YloU [Paeniglutamicibacter cryotolerans]